MEAPAIAMFDPVLLDLPVEIRTSRLLLRPPRRGDGAALHEAIVETLPELRRYLASLPWVAAEQTPDSAETFCRHAGSNFIARRDLPFFMFEHEGGRLIGACGLHRTVWTTPKTEVGYWCRRTAMGAGLVSEAVQAIVPYAFAHIGAVRVELVTDARNAASRRVAERCGFTLEATLRHERRAPDGTLRDMCLYARWPAPPSENTEP